MNTYCFGLYGLVNRNHCCTAIVLQSTFCIKMAAITILVCPHLFSCFSKVVALRSFRCECRVMMMLSHDRFGLHRNAIHSPSIPVNPIFPRNTFLLQAIKIHVQQVLCALSSIQFLGCRRCILKKSFNSSSTLDTACRFHPLCRSGNPLLLLL